jgi:hypothetical protein
MKVFKALPCRWPQATIKELNMADTDSKPVNTIAKTHSKFLTDNTEKHETVRKK